MKRLISLLLIIAFILPIFSSCKTGRNREVRKIEYTDPSPGNTQSIPETIPLPEAPIPTPTPPQKEPEKVPEKKPVKKPVPKPIASYSTPLLNKNSDRVYNIKLAAKKINGYKLKPDETFSFNDVVGKRDSESGYRKAPVIIDKEFEDDIGGGVCQLSSTIFNAADRAGLQITERHSHSRPVTYVPAGRDAAVSFDYLDLEFKNNKKYPVIIKVSVEKSRVYVSIWKGK